MTTVRQVLARLRGVFASWRRDDELDEELRAHLDLLADEHQRRGLSRADAEQAALRDFGGVARTRESYREQRGVPFLETLLQDLRYAIRMWRHSPGFSLVVVVVLALGIGANSAIFNIVEALFLRTLPVHDPGRLVFFSVESPRGSDDSFSFPDYLAYRDQNHVFAGIMASGGSIPARMTVTGAGAADVESVKTERVSGNFFSVLGVEPAAGRLLSEDDDRADRPGAVVAISYGFWKRRFGLDPQVVGRTLILNDTPMTVVGVASPGFVGSEIGATADLWFPLQMVPAFAHMSPARLHDRGWTWLRLMGRLPPETSAAQARAEIDVLYTTLREAAPPTFYVPVFQATINAGTTFIVRTAAGPDNPAEALRRTIRDVDPAVLVDAVRPLNELVKASVARERFVAQFATAFGAFALALAATGLYGLISYSVTRRSSDIAIRMALGAARRHVIWMVLREDLGLLAAGFVVGLPAAIALSKLVERLLFGVTATDPMTIVIAVAVMTGAGLVAGYLPARRASRLDALSALRCE